MKLACKECGKTHYKLLDLKPIYHGKKLDDDYYEQKNQCLSCLCITKHKMPYVYDGTSYRMIWDFGEPVQMHRKVMEMILGRELHPGERVQIINGKRNDSRPSNLRLVQKKKREYKGL